jgi:hypothetical protein
MKNLREGKLNLLQKNPKNSKTQTNRKGDANSHYNTTSFKNNAEVLNYLFSMIKIKAKMLEIKENIEDENKKIKQVTKLNHRFNEQERIFSKRLALSAHIFPIQKIINRYRLTEKEFWLIIAILYNECHRGIHAYDYPIALVSSNEIDFLKSQQLLQPGSKLIKHNLIIIQEYEFFDSGFKISQDLKTFLLNDVPTNLDLEVKRLLINNCLDIKDKEGFRNLLNK